MPDRYGTIVADPPWDYRWTGKRSGLGRRRSTGVDGAYATMSDERIRALPVASLAAPSAHLYLWVTNTRLFECDPAGIARAWGFEYKTLLTWHKTGELGLGHYFRSRTEHVLFCVRGSCPIDPALRVENLFAANRPHEGHSQKPDVFLDIVERVSPGPYLEMFSRRARFGWDTWGNESLHGGEAA